MVPRFDQPSRKNISDGFHPIIWNSESLTEFVQVFGGTIDDTGMTRAFASRLCFLGWTALTVIRSTPDEAIRQSVKETVLDATVTAFKDFAQSVGHSPAMRIEEFFRAKSEVEAARAILRTRQMVQSHAGYPVGTLIDLAFEMRIHSYDSIVNQIASLTNDGDQGFEILFLAIASSIQEQILGFAWGTDHKVQYDHQSACLYREGDSVKRKMGSVLVGGAEALGSRTTSKWAAPATSRAF